jgi:hypothetical protein
MCTARAVLTWDDWYLISYYRHVKDQVEGMAGLPRLEGYEAALRLYRYPNRHHEWLVTGAMALHALLIKQDTVHWQTETGKLMRDIRPEDVN